MADPDLPDVPALRPLDPPPGGLARLRAAFDAEPARDTRLRWSLVAVASAAALLVAWLVAGGRGDAPPALHVAERPRLSAPVADPAITTDAATFYWVASRPAGAAPEDEPAPARPTARTTPLPMVTFRR